MAKNKQKTKMSLKYSAYIEDIVSANSTFDKGMLHIAYEGKNRNGSYISTKSFEKATSSLAYVPLVANYSIDEDKIGSHDSTFRKDKNGVLKEYNLTDPLGVIPESPQWYWENVTEDDGRVKTYFCCEVLLWKRQAVYDHIKENGITDQSMEIGVNSYEMIDGVCHVTDFEFQAFTLLESAPPCFESACLETYSTDTFKESMDEMFEDFKQYCFEMKNTEITKKKEEHDLNKKELIKSFGFDPESLDFEYADMDEKALTEKLTQMKETKEFLLSSNLGEAMSEAFADQKVETDWGSYSKYFVVDYDVDSREVYAYDREDGYKLFGFSFDVAGDEVKVDFDSKKRKKYTIVDFEGSEEPAEDFSLADIVQPEIDKAKYEAEKATEKTVEEKYTAKIGELTSKVADYEAMEPELETLREFKKEADKKEKTAMLDSFQEKLKGSEEYSALYEQIEKFSVGELENECLKIIGKAAISGEFAYKNPAKHKFGMSVGGKSPESTANKPYGSLFDDFEK